MRILLIAPLLMVACEPVWPQVRAKHMEAVRKRASFDLQCPPDQLQLQPLDERKPDDAPRQYGVAGCGHRGAYVNAQSAYWETPGTWVLDSSTTKPPEQK